MDPLDEISVSPIKVISNPKGNVLHALKQSDNSFVGFGEAYFSFIDEGEIKGWKRHHKMFLNIIVPIGKIKFVIYDDRPDSKSLNTFSEFIIGPHNYLRLKVPPMVWMAFQGIDESNLLLNIANIEHSPFESESREITEFDFKW
jgi:dTDP-4-dehydrorhamnose 3,5-epimerase